MENEEKQEAFDDLDDGVRTSIGFGGIGLTRENPLRIGDEFYVLMHCRVVTDGREQKKDDDGAFRYKAGVSTQVLAELDAKSAAQVAAQHR